MLKKCFFLLSLLSVAMISNAQLKKNIEYSGFFDSYYWRGPLSVTGGFGTAFYSGDLCGKLDCQEYKPSFGAGLAYKVWPRVQFGAEWTNLKLASKDEVSTRNYSFISKSNEFTLFGKFYFIEDIIHKHQDIFKKPKLIKPFGKLGFGSIHMKPELYDSTGAIITEGLNRKYSFQIPFALGVQFDLSKRFAIITEFDARYTFTDQLDGFSNSATSGNELNDMYGGVYIKLQYSPFAPRVRRKKIKHSTKSDGDSEGSGSGDESGSDNDTPPASNGRPDGGSSTSDDSNGTVEDLPSNDEPAEEESTDDETPIEEDTYEDDMPMDEDFSDEEYSDDEYSDDEYSDEEYDEYSDDEEYDEE